MDDTLILEAGRFTFYFFKSGRMNLVSRGEEHSHCENAIYPNIQREMEESLAAGRAWRARFALDNLQQIDLFNDEERL